MGTYYFNALMKEQETWKYNTKLYRATRVTFYLSLSTLAQLFLLIRKDSHILSWLMLSQKLCICSVAVSFPLFSPFCCSFTHLPTCIIHKTMLIMKPLKEYHVRSVSEKKKQIDSTLRYLISHYVQMVKKKKKKCSSYPLLLINLRTILSFRNTAGKVHEGMNRQVLSVGLSYQFGLHCCLVIDKELSTTGLNKWWLTSASLKPFTMR